MNGSSVAQNYDMGYADGYADALHAITQWLIAKDIIRKEMFGSERYVAIDCNTLKPFTFAEVGEKEETK